MVFEFGKDGSFFLNDFKSFLISLKGYGRQCYGTSKDLRNKLRMREGIVIEPRMKKSEGKLLLFI